MAVTEIAVDARELVASSPTTITPTNTAAAAYGYQNQEFFDAGLRELDRGEYWRGGRPSSTRSSTRRYGPGMHWFRRPTAART